MKDVVEILTSKKKTIATMESCTGGAVASAITDVEGASEVLKFSAVTYSNEYKIKMGVSSDTILKYTVYSKETALAMAEAITKFTGANYGIGITGKLNRADKNNLCGDDNKVYVCIYDKDNNKKTFLEIMATAKDRHENKKIIIELITNKLLEII